ncbi:hypothetical protein [Methylomonas sp. MgM2]
MIQLPQPTEELLLHAASASGETPIQFLDKLLSEYLEEMDDIKAAQAAKEEQGGISLEEFRAKHGV